ncbi:MAG: bifunctional precorrin-2 dehydrogenase/sirohydrochlorin ferrochelatase [Chloroflexi bacterium]|nr:bifunctional precorrin-2 dehydrogenase/sirohydrochlorin ferrochelatase [Chloroflexota bacterium]
MSERGYYAAFLDLQGRDCVVLGGGESAAAKARGLLEAGAVVRVYAAHPCAALLGLAMVLVRRDYRPGDLAGAFLAIDASEDEAIHRAAHAEALSRRVLLNVMDRPELCTFIAPALVQRGRLQVAISTSGESPFLAKAVKALIERLLGDEWAPFVALLGDARRRLREARVPLPVQLAVYERLLASTTRERLKRGDVQGAERAIEAIVQPALERARKEAA